MLVGWFKTDEQNACKEFLTLLFVNSEDNDNFISVDTNKFLDRTNTSSGQFGQQNHSLSVIVFKLETQDPNINFEFSD